MNPVIISTKSNNNNIFETHGFLYHIKSTIKYFCLTSKIYPEKLPVFTDNTLTRAIRFISVYAFQNINFIILQPLYLSIYIEVNLYKHSFVQIFMDSALLEMCPYSELFWSAFSPISNEHGEIMRENGD